MKRCFLLILCALLLLSGCTAEGDFAPNYPTLSETEPETAEEILTYRREIVEQQMRFMSTVLWTPKEDISYTITNHSAGIEADKENQPENVVTLYAGRIYQGIPYTHGSGSGFGWLDYATKVDKNGVYTLEGLGSADLTGAAGKDPYNCSRMGNDCADQLFWAWAQISSSISFTSTRYMTPYYGCVKVGDYEFDDTQYNASTKNICSQNGEQRMFAAYAQMQKGDGMVLMTAGLAGHAVMTVSVHTEYKEDGTIDGEKSYAVILEQTSGCEQDGESYYNEELGKTVYLCEVADKEWSFNTLLKKGYLPVTCKELVDPSPLAEVSVTDCVDEPTASNLFTGMIKASYRICSVSVTITDKKGATVQEATCYALQSEMYSFNLFRFIHPAEKEVMQGSIDLALLEPGSYHCVYTCRLSTGDIVTFRDFDFTV